MPQFGTWSVPNCPLAIEYDLEILETVRREVTAGFQAPRGGVESGGLLLGNYDGKRVRITGFEPVSCEHELGPKFVLTEQETAALDRQLVTHRGRTREGGEGVVGWYQSHLRRGLTLSSEDIQLYDRHFPELWQVALLLRPDPAGGIHARFFLREPGTTGRPAPKRGTSARLDPSQIVPDNTPVSTLETANGQTLGRTGTDAAPATDTRRGIQSKAVWAVLAAMFVVAVSSVMYMRFNFTVTPHSLNLLHLETIARPNGLELRWDPKELGGASGGRLEVRDGARVQQIALDRQTLNSGVFLYRQTSDVIGFRLQTSRSSGAPLEGSAMYVARNGRPDAVAQVQPPTAVATEPAITPPPPSLSLSVPAATPPPVPPAADTDRGKTRVETTRPAAPVVSLPQPALPQPARTVEQPKTATSAPPVVTPPKREEPAKPKPESTTPPAPVEQTAATTTPTKNADVPAPAPAASAPRVETAAALPPRVIPKEPAATNTSAPSWKLDGNWTLQSGGFSRSPAVPESVSITVRDTDGTVQGTLEARYKGRAKAERVHFSFTGKVSNGIARFSWTSTGGRPSHIEFIRVPNSPDMAEVVWQNPENNHVFDEMLRRAK